MIVFLKFIAIVLMGFQANLCFALSLPKISTKKTVVVNNCIVPFSGINIPCVTEGEEGYVKITTLRCFDNPTNPYCLQCLEKIATDPLNKTRTQTCKVYDFQSKEIAPNK